MTEAVKDHTVPFVQTVCQGIFIFAITVILLTWLINKLKQLNYTQNPSGEVSGEVLEEFRQHQRECRQRMQEDHAYKAQHFQEKLAQQREAKLLKKEEDFYRFQGPAWKSDGIVLGGEDTGSADIGDNNNLSEGQSAAMKRRIPEQINQNVAAKAAAALAERQKQRKVITLSEEPDVNEQGVIVVMLRTPIGTICQRRFYASDKLQSLYDYMTTQGFSQRRYTVSTSYPRQILDNPGACFSSFDFGRRVFLNIEERE